MTDAYLCFEKFENLLGPVQVVWGLVRQSEADGFQLKESKCKELRISFSRSGSSVDHITINDKQIEVVSSAKLLGVVVLEQPQVERACRIYMQKGCDAPYVLPKTAKGR